MTQWGESREGEGLSLEVREEKGEKDADLERRMPRKGDDRCC